MKNHNNKLYKVIIPDLVSVETSNTKLPGSYLGEDLSFFKATQQKYKFHYRIFITKVHIPNEYDFRSGYYIKKKSVWYYYRSFHGVKLKMKYDSQTKTFYFNKSYLRVPTSFGGILPVGKIVSDMITLDLTLNGYIVVRGCSYKQNGRVYAMIRPSLNGKTSIIYSKLKQNANYISEDILVISSANGIVFPTIALSKNYGRKINRQLYELAKDKVVNSISKLDELKLLVPPGDFKDPDPAKLFREYLLLNGYLFLDNRFIKAYIFASGLSISFFNFDKTLVNNLPIINELGAPSSDLNTSYWNNVGEEYSLSWQSSPKQALSQSELHFISSQLNNSRGERIIDIGIGNGRIIEEILKSNRAKEIFGVDSAASMVTLCKKRFKDNSEVLDLKVVDISTEDLPFSGYFDFVTSIRVLKYNENWRDIVPKVVNRLSLNGIFIFSIPNKNSVNRFAKFSIPTYKSNVKEIYDLAEKSNFEVIEISGFTKIPDKVYELYANKDGNSLITLEKLLGKVFGPINFSKELFVVIKKKPSYYEPK